VSIRKKKILFGFIQLFSSPHEERERESERVHGKDKFKTTRNCKEGNGEEEK
jgi:hypothetical protein